MKFFLELVSWCGPHASPPPKEMEAPNKTPAAVEETMSWLVPSAVAPDVGGRNGRRQRGRGGVASIARPGLMTEWRPKLLAISENSVMPPAKEERTAAGSERIITRKVAPGRRSSSHCDDVRRAPLSAVMPAFSPAPFVF